MKVKITATEMVAKYAIWGIWLETAQRWARWSDMYGATLPDYVVNACVALGSREAARRMLNRPCRFPSQLRNARIRPIGPAQPSAPACRPKLREPRRHARAARPKSRAG